MIHDQALPAECTECGTPGRELCRDCEDGISGAQLEQEALALEHVRGRLNTSQEAWAKALLDEIVANYPLAGWER